MKTVYLVRHAKSSWRDAEVQTDIERPLNERGKRDAPFMGKILAAKGILPDALISSPAARAYKTAKLIAEELGYSKKNIAIRTEIYEASPYTILSVLQSLDNQQNTVMLFGHNPTFTEVANWYIGEDYIDNVPTCGIVAIDFDILHWQQVTYSNGKVVWWEFPKKYLPGIDNED